MSLSDRDQKLLDQIEQDLCEGDPQFAVSLGSARLRSGSRRLMMATIAGAAVGMTLVLAGLVLKMVILSVLGFLVIVAVAYAKTELTELTELGPPGEIQSPLRHRGR